MMYPAGEYIQIRNTTNIVIDDLYYSYWEHDRLKVRSIKAKQKENFMIITTNLQKDYDLIFYFGKDESKRFIYPDAVKKMTCDTTWCYQFFKIVESQGALLIEIDDEGKQAYFEDNQNT